MRKLYLILGMLGLFIAGNAQTINFSVRTEAYSAFTNGTSVSNGLVWDDPNFIIPIGFNFQYFNYSLDSIFVNSAGLGGLLTSNPFTSGTSGILMPFGADICDRAFATRSTGDSGGVSNVSYLLSGVAGNRILKIQWENAGFYSDARDDTVSTDYVNFQFWIYESNSSFEIHMGPNSVTQPTICYDGANGSPIGFYPEYDWMGNSLPFGGFELSGNPAAPTLNVVTGIGNFYLDSTIANGTVYRFASTSVAAADPMSESINFDVYPNPCTHNLNINLNNKAAQVQSIRISNASGQLVKSIAPGTSMVDLNELPSGLYFITIAGKNDSATRKFLKL